MKWLLLTPLALIALICCLRVGVRLCLENGTFSAFLLVRPFRLKVYPSDRKKADEPAEKPPKAEKEKQPGSSPSVQELCQYAKLGLRAFGALLRGLRVDLLKMHAVIHEPDPARTAISYGRACAAVSALLPALEKPLHIKKKDIAIDAGFQGESTLELEVQITACVGRLLAVALVYVIKFVILRRKVKTNEQSERNDE